MFHIIHVSWQLYGVILQHSISRSLLDLPYLPQLIGSITYCSYVAFPNEHNSYIYLKYFKINALQLSQKILFWNYIRRNISILFSLPVKIRSLTSVIQIWQRPSAVKACQQVKTQLNCCTTGETETSLCQRYVFRMLFLICFIFQL